METLTPQHLKAIRKLLAHNEWRQKQLASAVGVEQTAVSKWLCGHNAQVRDTHWDKLEPLLRPFLQDSGTPTARRVAYAYDHLPDAGKLEIMEILAKYGTLHPDGKA